MSWSLNLSIAIPALGPYYDNDSIMQSCDCKRRTKSGDVPPSQSIHPVKFDPQTNVYMYKIMMHIDYSFSVTTAATPDVMIHVNLGSPAKRVPFKLLSTRTALHVVDFKMAKRIS